MPGDRLNLFLVALNMNFSQPEPDWIFQREDNSYDVVLVKGNYSKNQPEVAAFQEKQIDDFIAKLWIDYAERAKEKAGE